jgi:hypothetical protein
MRERRAMPPRVQDYVPLTTVEWSHCQTKTLHEEYLSLSYSTPPFSLLSPIERDEEREVERDRERQREIKSERDQELEESERKKAKDTNWIHTYVTMVCTQIVQAIKANNVDVVARLVQVNNTSYKV